MARQKKTRKVGKIGVSKTSSNVRKPAEKRAKKPLGKPAGSRNNEATMDNSPTTQKVNKDPRHGSKKPVDLFATKAEKIATPNKAKYFSPRQELTAIEDNPKLAGLLDKLELGKTITKEEQHFVDQLLARHKVLCDMLGLSPEENKVSEKDKLEGPQTEEIDLYAQFEAIDINDFKN